MASYTRSASVLSVQHGVDTVLLDINQDQYFSLNPVAARCWALLGDHRSVDEIGDALAAEFAVAESVVREDVARFVKELEGCQLVFPSGS